MTFYLPHDTNSLLYSNKKNFLCAALPGFIPKKGTLAAPDSKMLILLFPISIVTGIVNAYFPIGR